MPPVASEACCKKTVSPLILQMSMGICKRWQAKMVFMMGMYWCARSPLTERMRMRAVNVGGREFWLLLEVDSLGLVGMGCED